MILYINVLKGLIVKLVLMFGDLLRVKYIVEIFLDEGYELVNIVRNVFMYTGIYKGKKVLIVVSGMGCLSIGIYSYELFKFYDVDKIIRVGFIGVYVEDLKLYDIVLVDLVYVDLNVFRKLVLNDYLYVVYLSVLLNEEIKKFV